MPFITIGSINIDHSYRVPHFLQPGETLACQSYQRGLGGKGMNQSVALHRAGAQVLHLGAIGRHDAWVRAAMLETGVDLGAVIEVDADTGHAIIQLDAQGQNCILIHPGANQCLQASDIEQVLQSHSKHAWVLTQNETSAVPDIFERVLAHGRRLAFNPAPCDPALAQLPLQRLAVLFVNEVEVCQLAQTGDINAAFTALRQRCPETLLVMTLGPDGLRAAQGAEQWIVPACPTTVVDTTGAGDTITGYVLAALDAGRGVEDALHWAARAAAITVSRPGAAASIPWCNAL